MHIVLYISVLELQNKLSWELTVKCLKEHFSLGVVGRILRWPPRFLATGIHVPHNPWTVNMMNFTPLVSLCCMAQLPLTREIIRMELT